MTRSRERQNTRAKRARNQRILAASDVCHVCGHPGADAVDHVVPIARGGTDTMDNLRPAHHTEACETCGRKCNREKTDKRYAPILRRSGALK